LSRGLGPRGAMVTAVCAMYVDGMCDLAEQKAAGLHCTACRRLLAAGACVHGPRRQSDRLGSAIYKESGLRSADLASRGCGIPMLCDSAAGDGLFARFRRRACTAQWPAARPAGLNALAPAEEAPCRRSLSSRRECDYANGSADGKRQEPKDSTRAAAREYRSNSHGMKRAASPRGGASAAAAFLPAILVLSLLTPPTAGMGA
jgi:hypothetical protein